MSISFKSSLPTIFFITVQVATTEVYSAITRRDMAFLGRTTICQLQFIVMSKLRVTSSHHKALSLNLLQRLLNMYV